MESAASRQAGASTDSYGHMHSCVHIWKLIQDATAATIQTEARSPTWETPPLVTPALADLSSSGPPAYAEPPA